MWLDEFFAHFARSHSTRLADKCEGRVICNRLEELREQERSKIKMPDLVQASTDLVPQGKRAEKSESQSIDLDCTVNELQQQLATWVCPKCKCHYSRIAARCVDWRCEDCKLPLLGMGDQKAA